MRISTRPACTLFAAASLCVPAAWSQDAAPVQLEEVVVTERSDSLVGIASSANAGVVGAEQLARRPLLRPAEIVETVPGVIVSQHSGAGKANQFYLRGFNLDHGTDLATSVDGVPVNMRTHAHGQGYTDLNFLIPEFVREVGYKKGPYYAEEGDFASAGAFHIEHFDRLERGFLTLEGGTDGYARLVFGHSVELGKSPPFSPKDDRWKGVRDREKPSTTLLYGFELYHHDGPWQNPDDYQKINGLVRLSGGDRALGWSLTAMAYHGDWTASDQLAKRAVDRGLVDRFGSLDESTGGDSSRYSLSGEWHRADEHSATKILLYGLYYDLDLFSNFTYLLDDPERGDQFEQKDRRIHWGAQVAHTLFGEIFGLKSDTTVGIQFRQDNIRNGLFHTELRKRLETTRSDHTIESSAGVFVKNETRWTQWFRTEAGLRADYYHFDVNSGLSVNDGQENDSIASPKLSLIFGPWAKTEFYLNGGFGFHSNDARGVITRTDPGSGERVTPADPLVRTRGAEIGLRTTALPGLQSSVALWVLDIDSELLFVGDAGTTEPSRPSRRFGIEWTNYYNPTPWLTIDADFAWSQARFSESAPEGQRIPGSIETVIAAGVSLHDLPGMLRDWSASARVRYFGPRDLIEDGSVQSDATTLVNAQIGYRFNETWSAALDVFNIFDSEVSDIDYFYTSRLRGEPEEGVDDIHFHPAEPRQFRLSVTAKF
jgi:outer membrane receptor protein involved in Fe transport